MIEKLVFRKNFAQKRNAKKVRNAFALGMYLITPN